MGPTSVGRGQQRPDGISLLVIQFTCHSVELLRTRLHFHLVVIANVKEPARVTRATSVGGDDKVTALARHVEQRVGSCDPRSMANRLKYEHRTGGTSMSDDASRESIEPQMNAVRGATNSAVKCNGQLQRETPFTRAGGAANPIIVDLIGPPRPTFRLGVRELTAELAGGRHGNRS